MNVMLSYRSTESDFVDKFAEPFRRLAGAGTSLWIDREGIKPGQKWRDELLAALRSCDACIPVLSPSYLQSEHCRMEVFIARSLGKKIFPMMVGDSFAAIREHEETKGLEDIFMILWHQLSAVGLPITEEEAMRRIVDAVLDAPRPVQDKKPVYVSYTPRNATFATSLADRLAEIGIPTWVATREVRAGENWRDAQARAMMRACAHVVVLDEGITDQKVLRTEILLAEAQGLEVLTVLPPDLIDPRRIGHLMNGLNASVMTYRRLAAVQAFPSTNGVDEMVQLLAKRLAQLGAGQQLILEPRAPGG
jgi:hypothetical protein